VPTDLKKVCGIGLDVTFPMNGDIYNEYLGEFKRKASKHSWRYVSDLYQMLREDEHLPPEYCYARIKHDLIKLWSKEVKDSLNNTWVFGYDRNRYSKKSEKKRTAPSK
jgi:hypothetical protein